MPIFYFAIVAGFSYIGFSLAGQYDRKRQIFADLLAFCGALKANLNYMRLPLDAFYESYVKNVKGDLGAYFTKRVELPFLTAQQRSETQAFFEGLGKNDTESQKQHIAFYVEIFERNLSDATVQCKEKGNMYRKLSVLLGVLICILIM